MNTINERIAQLVEHFGLTKTAFGKRIMVSQQFVSDLCLGKKIPSDRTIADICREFDVNESWLRSGDGEMIIEKTRDQEIAEFIADIMRDEEDNFKRRFVAMLARLDEHDWEVLAKMAKEMAED